MPGGYGKINEWAQENPELAKEVKRKAGRKSGETRRKQKTLKEYLSAILSIKTETGDLASDITVSLIQKALEGDVQAYKEIRSTLGQDAPQLLELNSNIIKVNITGDDDE